MSCLLKKKICENLIGTLLGIKGKTKDIDKACLHLKDQKIRDELHLQQQGTKWIKPQAS